MSRKVTIMTATMGRQAQYRTVEGGVQAYVIQEGGSEVEMRHVILKSTTE